jgi:hypothetical protein
MTVFNQESRGNPNRCRRTKLLLAVAAGLAVGAPLMAQTEFTISTSGATALGAFTRMNNSSSSPSLSSINRGPLSVGSTVTIGTTTYTIQPGISYLGIANANQPEATEPTTSMGRLLYYYRESGSVQGVLDLADSNGLRATLPGTEIRPGDPAGNLFLWVNGSRFNGVTSGYSSGTLPNVTNGTPFTGRTNGRNYTIGSNPTAETTPNGQAPVRIAWSDVRFEQAFSVSGASASSTATPTTAGYGLGRGSIGGTNFQQLRNQNAIVGGIDPSTTRLRNEKIAVVPFNLVANPGTGLAEVSKDQAKWLQATGRLANGADFNSVTREIGSGTRNQGALNLGIDPSWAGGERDRRALASYQTLDVNGNAITVNIGDEADPVRSLTGSTVQDVNENRIGPSVRFSDKISGSSGVRATVVASRMSLGILSAGDSRDTAGNALAAVAGTHANPMRALRIDWDDAGIKTGTQATAANVINGSYEMWSAAQAVTVAPYANPTANDSGANVDKPINGDTNDQNVGGATSATEVGVHRKFLNNITQSIATYTSGQAPNDALTPADFIIQSAFIPTGLMGVEKTFDGGAQTPRSRSTEEEATYQQAVVASNGVLNDQTKWADPSTMNGGVAAGAVTYKIFASANNASSATANRTITVNTRTNLAGDFNNDKVRDVLDVDDMALAYASPSAYLATPQGAGVASTSNGTNASAQDGLIVLSDFNANGNVAVDANNATFATRAVERADVKFFLYGASVDTSAFDTGADDAAKQKNRRENGVRFGQLKKNQAIDSFNNKLQSFVGTLTNPATSSAYTQPEIDALKFDRYDVNGDGVRNRLDAKIVDRSVGKNYTNLNDVLGTWDDLVAAELDDNNAITSILNGGTSDFKLVRDALGSSLLDGDANFDGAVDVADFKDFASHWSQTVDRWSFGDFNLDGQVNTIDLGMLAVNWNQSAGSFADALASAGIPPSAVPEPTGLALAVAAASASLVRRRR